MAKARKGARGRPPAPKKTRKPSVRARGQGEREQLLKRIAGALQIDTGEAELRALRELAERVAPQKAPPDRAHQAAEAARAQIPGGLPAQLYLLLDGRGLDGRGMPVQLIDAPAVVGSGRQCAVWVNSPRIETRHLQFSREDGDWYVEDLHTAHGTFLGDERVGRRRVQHGDEYRLAGYLRLRTEFR
jgi:FHA domain-containing protein